MYNNFYYNQYDQLYEQQRKQTALRLLRKHGNLSGAGVLIFLASSAIISFVLIFFKLTDLITKDEIIAESFDIIVSIVIIFVPFLFIMSKAHKYHNDPYFAIEMPKNKRISLWAIPAGMMLCLVGDKIASIISAFFMMFGIELTSSSSVLPVSFAARVLYFISVVIVAPLVEEFAMRAVVMQPLRKYGDVFAIIMSALVFALMHQNMVQGIFAFVAGVSFGYICIITGSVWCSVAIHCLNNFLSVLSQIINANSDPGSGVVFYNFLIIAMFVAGIIGLVIILRSKERPTLQKSEINTITTGEKVKAFLFAPPMIIAIVVMAVNCLI